MFKELGWDMANEERDAETYKEVVHDASLKIGEENKAPDYCFRNRRDCHDRASVQSQISAIDRLIAALVYELNGLSDVEIKIVEGPET